jgi:hypothetical protein
LAVIFAKKPPKTAKNLFFVLSQGDGIWQTTYSLKILENFQKNEKNLFTFLELCANMSGRYLLVGSGRICFKTFYLREDAMKTLQVFFGAGAMVALLGFLSIATADVRNDSIKSLTFSVDVGDGSVGMPEVSFDDMGSGAEETQTTCAMTPGGNMPGLLLEQPIVPTPDPERLVSAPDEALAPLSSLQTPPPYQLRTPYGPRTPEGQSPGGDPSGPDPPPQPDPDPSPVVPEPATLLLVGLGIGVAAYGAGARRRRKD